MARLRPDPEYRKQWRDMKKLGMLKASWSDLVMLRELQERGIEVGSERQFGLRRMTFELGGRKRRWRDGRAGLNPGLLYKLASSKAAMSAMLRDKGLPAIENAMFEEGDEERAWVWAQKFPRVVLKPNAGAGGRNVFVGVSEREEFISAFTHIIEQEGGHVVVEEQVEGDQYRCLLIGRKLAATLLLDPPNVVGDGARSIAELIEIKNERRDRLHVPLRLDEKRLNYLAKQGYEPESIPEEGEKVYLLGTSNVAQGGDIIAVGNDALTPEEVRLVEAVGAELTASNLLGIDIMRSPTGRVEDLRVLEVNSMPQTSMHHFPWEGEPQNVSGAILDFMESQGSGKKRK